MLRTTRIAVAAAVAAAVSLGVAAPAATAAPRTTKAPAVTTTKAAKPASVVKAERRLAAAKATLVKQIAQKDKALAGVPASVRYARLAAPVATGVNANVAADRALLASYRTQANAATTLTALSAPARGVAAVRPELYRSVVSELLGAARVQAQVPVAVAVVDALAVQADAKELEGFDVTEVRTLLDDARAAAAAAEASAASATARALTVRATSGTAALRPVRTDLAAARASLESVTASTAAARLLLDAMVPAPVAEPVAEPVVTEPTA